MTTPDIEIRQVPDRQRFEILVDGKRVGLSTYRDVGNRRVFIHTETDPEREGQGLAGKLVRSALDQTRAEGLLVVPQCPFVKAFIEGHLDYADLVAS